MISLSEQSSSLIEPLYHQRFPNEAIRIGCFPAGVAGSPPGDAFDVNVSVEFASRPSLVFESRGDTDKFGIDKITLVLPEQNTTLHLNLSSRKFSDTEDQIVRLRPDTSIVKIIRPHDGIKRTVCHLFNFPHFLTTKDYVITTQREGRVMQTRCGQVELHAGGWKITLAGMESTSERLVLLKNHGGWIITHMVEIVRKDGGFYTDEDLEDVLYCLRYFLSFTLGRWAGVALPVGFGTNGNRVYQKWGTHWITPGCWNQIPSWFSDNHAEWLTDLFGGFWDLWHREPWKMTLAKAIYWNVSAAGDVDHKLDVALVATQPVLELLAWTYCVRERQLMSPDGFRKLRTSDQFRLLAASLDIPLDISTALVALCDKYSGKGHDAMYAITDIRNELVHPKTDNILPHDIACQGWFLCSWYVDQIILRLCGYNGQYANKINNSEIEPLPHQHEV